MASGSGGGAARVSSAAAAPGRVAGDGLGLEAGVLLLFLVSGATALVYETVWARRLHLVLGSSQLAVSVVLAAFMAGLAAGGFAGARWARSTPRPLLAYAGLEAAIGLYALAYPALETAAKSAYLSFPAVEGTRPWVAIGAQVGVALVLLLPPTTCMGATLPLLTRLVTPVGRPVGAAIGRLYATNTVGAVAGAALAGFVLLPTLGLRATTRWTVAANLVVSLAAVALSIGRPPVESRDGAEPAAGTTERGRSGVDRRAPRARDRRSAASAVASRSTRGGLADRPRAILVLAAMTGAAALVYEVSWFRLVSLVVGGSAYAFSILLVAFLLGLGLGGWPGGVAADRAWRRGGAAAVLRLLAGLELGVATTSWVALFAYAALPSAWVSLYQRFEGAVRGMWLGHLGLALAIMLAPALLMGAAFPCLARLATGAERPAEHAAGSVYGANTLGAIAGALGGSLLLLPTLHLLGSVLAAATLNVAAALVAVLAAAPSAGWRRGLAAALAAGGVVVIGWWRRPEWNPLVMTSGMYQYASRSDAGALGRTLERLERMELLFYDEGLSSLVTVSRDPADGQLALRIDGKVDASTGADMKTQVLLAHLPLLFRPDAANVLVVGFASGTTAGTVTLHPGPRRIDIAEIEPAVVAASHFFDGYNHAPLADPRVSLQLDDARHRLLRAPDRHYDLISSEPSNPWLTGASSLFTLELFELGRRKLAPGGVWAQWLHTYEMAPEDLRSLLATFAAVFPELAVFSVNGADLIALGSDTPFDLRPESLRERLAASPVRDDLARWGLGRVEDVLAHFLLDRPAVMAVAGPITLNTDDNLRVEYSAPLHLFEDTAPVNERLLAAHAIRPWDDLDGVDELVTLARAYARAGQWRLGMEALAAALERGAHDPSLPLLHFELGSMAAASGATDDAVGEPGPP